MKLAFAAALGLATLLGGTAQAASLCNCCGSETAQSCATLVRRSRSCLANAWRPSTSMPKLDDRTRPEPALRHSPAERLVGFRRQETSLKCFAVCWKAARKAAEADRRKALAERRKGSIDAATAEQLARRYDDAMVNYYLGMQSYRIARSSGS